MVSGNVKLVIGIAIIAIALFSGIIFKYTLRKDPTAIKRLSEKEVSQVEVQPSGDNTSTDNADIFSSVADSEFESSVSSMDSSSKHRDDTSSEIEEDSSELDGSSSDSDSQSEDSQTDKERVAKELEELSEQYDRAADKFDEAKEALEDAENERDELQEDYDEAQKKLEKAIKKYESGNGKLYNRGLFAFLESVGADEALDLLENSAFSGYLDPSDPGDPSSLESVKRSLELLDEANYFREWEGRNAFRISYNMMAIAVLNNAKTSSTRQVENLTDLVQDAAFGYNDPYDAWYYDEISTGGGNYRNLMNDDYVVAGYGFSSKNGNVHNLLFADADYDSGISVNLSRFTNDFNKFYDSVKKSKECTELEELCEQLEKELKEAEQNITEKEKTVRSAQKAFDLAKEDYEEKKEEYEAFS